MGDAITRERREAADPSTLLPVGEVVPVDEAVPTVADFVEKLGSALHRYGTPAHRLEEALSLVSRRFGLAGQFFSTPTAIFATFGRRERTRLMRVEPGDVNLEKLSQVDHDLDLLIDGSLDVEEASRRLDAVESAPQRYGPALTMIAFAAASGSASSFFGGGLPEVAASSGIGLLIGLFAILVPKMPSVGRLFELFASLTASLVAAAIAAAGLDITISVVTLAGLIVLVPGFTLTTAMTELATRNLVSGSSRLAATLMMFFTIGFGVTLGQRLAEIFFGVLPTPVPVPLPAWSIAVALLVAAAAFTILFRARPQDFLWIVLASFLAYGGSRMGARWLGPEMGALVGAILLGVGGNVHARWLRRPSAVTQVPGLMLLVPGSIGFRSVNALVEHDVMSGVQAAFAMVLVATGLAVGLLVANVLVPPRRAL